MTARRTTSLATAATVALALTGALLSPAADAAASAKGIPVVSAHLGRTVTLSRTHLHPGRVTFAVHSSKGAHTLQIASLHKGYTLQQANQDIGAAFGGNVAAVRRVDANVNFKGGVPGSPHKPGRVTVYLSAGNYLAVNFDNGQAAAFTVSGAAVNRATVRTTDSITMLTYGFDTAPTLHRSGVLRLTNTSDQPHFLVMQHVKKNTTRAQLQAAFASESESTPAFLLKAGIDTGVLSPTKTQSFSYSLPAGRYVIACFWPDNRTGMQHAAMGMFKLITLT